MSDCPNGQCGPGKCNKASPKTDQYTMRDTDLSDRFTQVVFARGARHLHSKKQWKALQSGLGGGKDLRRRNKHLSVLQNLRFKRAIPLHHVYAKERHTPLYQAIPRIP